jgi:clan AA aspartic protease
MKQHFISEVWEMNGQVDDLRRALLELRVGYTPSAQSTAVTVWIDTAFDGFLVFSKSLIESLDLDQEAATEAILADGSRVTLESYVCYVNWFGEVVAAQVIANEGRLPLLGTELLANRRLVVDYAIGRVSLN